MKTPRLAFFLGFAVAAVATIVAADLNVTGNITATGTIDSDGNTTSFGAQSTSVPTLPGVILTYTDNSVDTFKTLINRNPGSWLWLHNTASGTANAMRLDSAHQLILYNAAGTAAGVTLTPASNRISLGTATLTGSGNALSTNGAFTAGGNMNFTGTDGSLALNSSGVTLSAVGGNKNITLTPSGTGYTILNGKVGIGTAAPQAKLDVRGSIIAANTDYSNGVAGSFLQIQQGATSGNTYSTIGAYSAGGTAWNNLVLQNGGGNVGIGTASPQYKFSLGSASDKIGWYSDATHYNNIEFYNSTTGGMIFDQNTGAGGGYAWKFAGSPLVAFQSNGNVGIGTTSPATKLVVSNGGAMGLEISPTSLGDNMLIQSYDRNASVYKGIRLDASNLNFMVNGTTPALTVNSAGNVGIGTTSPNSFGAGATVTEVHGTTAYGALLTSTNNVTGELFAAEAGEVYVGSRSNHPLQLATGNVPRVTISTAGDVGIGTTSPNAKLQVVGSALIGSAASSAVELYSTPPEGGTIKLYGANGVNTFLENQNGTFRIVDSPWSTEIFNVTQTGNGYFAGNLGISTAGPRSRLDIGGSLGAGKGARFGDYLEINEREVINNANTIGWNAFIAADDGTFAPTYAPGTGMVLSMSGGGTADLDFLGRSWGGSATPVNLNSFTPVMRLSTNGNVGIGTQSPATKLHIVATSLDESNTVNFTDTLKLQAANGGTGGIALQSAWDNSLNTSKLNFRLGYYASGNQGRDVLTMVANTGNVGIGTTTPAKKLHVAGTGSMQVDPDDGSLELASGNDGMSYIDFKGSTNLGADYRGRMLYADGTGFAFSTGQSYSNQLVIREGGNVGIGTDNPTQKLSVNGTIRAKEIIVDTGWADYVFDANYRLAPLSDVEAHIKAKKHLPGIPSAAEISKHGVSMGDMQSKLLSKIEELTLHMIAQEKRIEKLEQENRQLKSAATP